MMLPDIPRLYTALAEVLAVLVYAQAAPPRAAKPVTYAATAGWAAVLGVFLQLTGSVPLAWWLPCMVAAIAWLYLYLWGTREMNLLEAGYSCARAFILAELAASVEWQLHCVLWPQQRATAPLSVLLLAADIACRMLVPPVVLPIGALTSFLGAPLFLYLILKRGNVT